MSDQCPFYDHKQTSPCKWRIIFGKLTRHLRCWNSYLHFLQLCLICIWMQPSVVVLDDVSSSIAMFVLDTVMDNGHSLLIQFTADKCRLNRCCFHGSLLQERCMDSVSHFPGADLQRFDLKRKLAVLRGWMVLIIFGGESATLRKNMEDEHLNPHLSITPQKFQIWWKFTATFSNWETIQQKL